ncbi:MAG: PspC domain-containing protein [Ignavibacteria bacterium]|nr:PspC domain-containing protein [Ignavibacteria bacterium]
MDGVRKLRKSKDKKIAGVLGGLAEYLGVDPTIVRLVYVLLSLLSVGFPGLLIYIIMWVVLPPPEN